MTNPHNVRGAGVLQSGLTLPELTLTLAVVLALVGLLFTATSLYAAHADKTSCVIAQTQMRKALVSYANISNMSFEPGVDYYTEAVYSGLFDGQLTCPESGGAYSIMLDDRGRDLVITCKDHGDHHR
ncbi:MAG: hypothetical protein H7A51_08875 [Akkermansiaceae bacterium]|nr:hypothetical protein [Akkermansiaceae bacterium]